MSLIKGRAIKLIKSLPDDCTIEDIQYHLYVLETVEKGIKAIDEGRVYSHEQVKSMVKEWRK